MTERRKVPSKIAMGADSSPIVLSHAAAEESVGRVIAGWGEFGKASLFLG